ncbi:hypothetical protein [Nostoc sp.]|uniref:hypothetical protein n=1 Tax=Nostoc sp. TaxID=1180 RepID=UPI002FF57D95
MGQFLFSRGYALSVRVGEASRREASFREAMPQALGGAASKELSASETLSFVHLQKFLIYSKSEKLQV